MFSFTLRQCFPYRTHSRGLFSLSHRTLSTSIRWCQLQRQHHNGISLHTVASCHRGQHFSKHGSNLNNMTFHQRSTSVDPISFRSFRSSACLAQASQDQAEKEKLVTEMNMRHVNENSFLSWCRNAYLSTVVGAAMMAEGAGTLAQSAGLGALLVGSMNLGWGTACHITNLIRLRHVSGMSNFTLMLHLTGSVLHCILWGFVLVCYIGFLDEYRFPEEEGVPHAEELERPRLKGRGLRDNLPRH